METLSRMDQLSEVLNTIFDVVAAHNPEEPELCLINLDTHKGTLLVIFDATANVEGLEAYDVRIADCRTSVIYSLPATTFQAVAVTPNHVPV